MSDEIEEVRLEPEPGILIESLRDIGYSFNSALADIVDNSITAKAKTVSIFAVPTDKFKIAIIDDGEGLSRDDLKQAMRLGSSNPRQDRALDDLGRFGLGLKTASFSQCRRLTVASKKDGSISAFTWDLDRVVATNSWMVLEHSDVSEVPYANRIGDSGTLVLWENLDRLTGSRGSGKIDYARVISEAQDYLSLVFHRFLAGERGLSRLTISVNNLELDPIDPFNSKNRATQASPTEIICPGVTMQAYTLPHRATYKAPQEYERFGLRGGYLKSQGIYLYRAKRLILFGTWFGLIKKTALTQLCRVKIDIDTTQDELWKIDVKKVSAQPPEIVRERIKSLVATIGAPSKKVYRKRAARLTSPEVFPTWSAVREGDGITYRINRENPVIESFLQSLDGPEAKSFETVLALIESTFPTESLFYEFSKNEEGVSLETLDADSFRDACRTFFSTLSQSGHEDEAILSIMRTSEPFSSRWNEVLDALEIKEL